MRSGLVALCGALLALAVATPAQAFQTHALDAAHSPFGSFNVPLGIAVDSDPGSPSFGDVYVGELSGKRVVKFDSTGHQLGVIDHAGAQAFTRIGWVATDPVTGDLYVGQFDPVGLVYKFDASGNLDTTFGDGVGGPTGVLSGRNTNGGSMSGVAGIAVSPTSRDLYVADRSHKVIDIFDQHGNYITAFPTDASSAADGIAVDPAGDVYVVGDFHPLKEYKPSANPPTATTTFDSGTTIDPNSTRAVALDPSNGSLYVYETASGLIVNMDPSGNVLDTFGAPQFGESAGLAAAAGSTVYATDLDHNNADIFTLLPAIPDVTVQPASYLLQHSATLHGHVSPDSAHGGGPVTDCHFEYGTTTSYSLGSVPCLDSGNVVVGTPGNPITSPTDVHADLSGLALETTYHDRLVASNANGTNRSPDQTFTPHAVVGLSTDAATNITPTTATLNGSFVGNGDHTHYYFKWGTTTGYGNTTPVVDAGSPSGPNPTALPFELQNLNPVTTYHYQVVATNGTGTSFGSDRIFTTPHSVPLIKESVTNVHSDAAVLNAQINPGGGDTTYHFEYGTADCSANPCTSFPASDADIGSDGLYHSVSVPLSGLAPGTTYHFRVVATNLFSPPGGTLGPDRTFTTFTFTPVINDPCPNALARQQTGAALLLDCRAYELVSAPDTGGYDVESNLVGGQTPFGGYPQADSKVLYGVHNGAIPGTGNPTNHGIDPYVATRGANGWSTSYVGIPADSAPSSPPFGSPLLAADPSLDTFAFGGTGICAPCFGNGSTGIPLRMPDASLAQGMAGTWDQGASSTPDGLIAKPFSADGSHLVFGSVLPFEPDGNSNGDVSIYDRNLKTGITHVVSKTPGGLNLPCVAGAGTCHSPGDTAGTAELDISANGSRIVVGQLVSTDANGNHYYHLYMNVGDSGHTIDLTPGPSGALYDGMSADGTKVYFSTKDKLTGDDHDTSADIYRADVTDSAATLTRVSIDPSAAPGGIGDTNSCTPDSGWNAVGGGSNCDAVAIGGGGVASGDGTIYFLSPEQLDGSGAPNEPNLFVARPGSAPHFVATLETANPAVVDARTAAGARHTADFQVTPSGDFAAFATTQPLKANYDNAGHSEVYRYDAPTDQLDCASCNPTNAQANGDASLASNGLSLTNDGRVFFNSTDPLVLSDTNNKQDVYEWENGDVQLISTGTSPFDSGLLSASADGTDAHFFTHDTLVSTDHNSDLVKVYDARAGGGFFAVPPPPPCVASDECHGAGSSSPGAPNIGSGSGSGGNATPPPPAKTCKAGFVKKQGKCVLRHHHKRRNHKRANANRGGAK